MNSNSQDTIINTDEQAVIKRLSVHNMQIQPNPYGTPQDLPAAKAVNMNIILTKINELVDHVNRIEAGK